MAGETYATLVCDEVSMDVVLVAPGRSALGVAHVVRRLTGLSLWHSKTLVDRASVVVLTRLPEDAAGQAVAALREAGAQAEARQHP